jgi:PleD family two-component response regulator
MATKRILLIEDDFDVAEMLLMYFKSHAFDIFHAEDGSVGIDMARTHFPNVILLDVMLPYMDGYEVCRQLRQKALTKYIPIIFLTQRDERADRVRGLELGADDYITKPFDVDELRLRVEGSIRRATRASLHETRTGLPTGALIDDELRQRAATGYVFFLGIDGFSAYREIYGFMAADEVFGFAARCIQELISAEGTPQDFVGVRDDHFVVLTHAAHAPALEARIKDRFAEGVKAFYNFQDVEQGGVLLEANSPSEKLVPLMCLHSVQAAV